MKKSIILLSLILLMLISCTKKYTPVVLWEIQTKGKTAQVQFSFQDKIIVTAGEYIDYGSPNHLVYSMDAKTGKIIWLTDIGKGVIVHELTIKDKIIFMKTTDDKIIRIDAVSGKLITGNISIMPARMNKNHEYNGNPCFASGGKIKLNIPRLIFCKDKKTGKKLWSFVVPRVNYVYEPDNVDFSFVIENQRVFIGQYNGKITCLEIRK